MSDVPYFLRSPSDARTVARGPHGGPQRIDLYNGTGVEKLSSDVGPSVSQLRGRVEPLHMATWLKQLRDLGSHLDTLAEGSAIETLVRRAFHLSVLSPDPFWRWFAAPCNGEAFEACMDREGVAAGLDQLINPALAVDLVKPDGNFEASVQLAEVELTGTGVGSDRARAVLTAWLDCIAKLHAECEKVVASLREQDPRRSRSSPDRSSTLH